MQGRQQICILCRSIGRPVRTIPQGRREASQLRSLEPYDASKLILDLDAADSKYVRRYEDQHEDQARGPSISARNSFHEAKVQAKAQANPPKRQNPKNVPDLWRPAPIDFIRYALVDNLWKSNTKGNAHLRKVLSGCLLPGLGKFEDHIKWLRAYEILPYKVEQFLHVSDEQAIQYIESVLSDISNIYESSRITSLLTRTIDGCKFVASNGPVFLNRIQLKPSNPTKRRKMRGQRKLKYINAVIQRLESMGVDPGSEWYVAGLYNAMRASCYPALKKYIDIVVTRKDTIKLDVDLLRSTLEDIVPWPFHTTGERRVRYIDEDGSMKDDFLKLLTGWEKLGIPEGDELRKPCFALLLQDDPAMYGAYIEALTKLEAYDALWYEFNRIDLTPIPDRTERSDGLLFEQADIFAKAFIHLRDPLQALQVFKRVSRDQSSLDSENRMPSSANHVSPSNKAIPASRSILSIPELSQDRIIYLRRALADKYLIEEVYDVDKGSLLEDLKRLDLCTPENISDLVSVLSTYWSHKEDKKIRKLVDDEGFKSPAVQLAVTGISRRLDALGEDWKTRVDISNWCMNKDLQRLKQLREDLDSSILVNLPSSKPSTKAEDDLKVMCSSPGSC